MSRDIDAATKAESLKGAGAKPRAFAKLALDSGTVRVWSGRGTRSFDIPGQGGPELYDGVGGLGKVSSISEESEVRAFGISLELSGVDPDHISLSLQEPVQGRKAQIWLGFVDEAEELVGPPTLLFRGRMDTIDGELGDSGVVVVTAESRLADWARARTRRYTSASHNERWPGDKFFDFVGETVEREIVWGGSVAGGQGGGAVSPYTSAGGVFGGGGGGARNEDIAPDTGGGPQR